MVSYVLIGCTMPDAAASRVLWYDIDTCFFFKKTQLDCVVLNHSHIVATKQAGSFYIDAQTSHHVSYRNGLFDAGLHGAELGTIG